MSDKNANGPRRERRKRLFQNWGRMEMWNLVEGPILLAGGDPGTTNEAEMRRTRPTQAALRTLSLAQRAVEAGTLKKKNRPIDFLDWATGRGLTVPKDLDSAVRERTAAQSRAMPTSTTPPAPQQDDLREVERITLLKILLGVAREKYGYNPGAARNLATGEGRGSISADLVKHDLSVHPDTIRKYLKEACD